MTVREATLIDEIAALYGDPSDPEFAASGLIQASLNDLYDMYMQTSHLGMHEVAALAFDEIARLQRPPDIYSNLLAASAGIWRIH